MCAIEKDLEKAKDLRVGAERGTAIELYFAVGYVL